MIKRNKIVAKIVFVMTMVLTAGVFCSENTFALDCDSNESTHWACYDCGSANCGASWLNGDEGGNEENVFRVDGQSTGDVIGWLHGAIYTHRKGPSYSATASHVWLLNSYPDFGYGLVGGGKWDPAVGLFAADYVTDGQGNDIYRGVQTEDSEGWSTGWEDGGTPIRINLEKFIQGARQENDDFIRDAYVYRCYDGDAGCDATATIIRVRIPEIKETVGDYYTFYQGRTTVRKNGGSELFENGSPFTSTKESGWEDGSQNVSVNLYTPKKSGHNLSSAFDMRKAGNSWDNQWLSFYWELGQISFRSSWNYQSSIGGSGGHGTYYYWDTDNQINIGGKSGTIGDIPYGTSKTITETMNYNSNGDIHGQLILHKRANVVKWIEPKEYGNNNDEAAFRSRTINVNISNPFNFNTSMSSAINGGSGSTIIGGGTATLRYSADITPKINSNINNYPYYSEVPSDTKVTAVSFLLKPGVDFNTVNSRYSNLMKDRTDTSNIPGGNLCRYLASIFGNDMIKEGEANGCRTLINRNGGDINRGLGNAGEKTSTGASAIAGEESKSVTIPDIEDGHKYCTVIGISHADSGDGFNVNNNWHISNISCRTIAKVPTFQAWGGVYTSGGINTTTVKKVPSADIGTSSGNRSYLFGSWAETLAVANQQIHGFATGAAIGYLGDKLGGFPITNSGSGKINYCNVTNMSIANNQCNNKVSGNAGNIVVSNSDFLSKFVSHYTTTGNGLQQVTDSVKYYKVSGNVTFNDTGEIARENISRLRNGVISVNEGTLIFQVDGDVTINHNICTGYISSNGQCTNGAMTGSATLGSENYQYRAGATKIPQVIIIASGNVNISKDVTEIDAWIYSDKTIKTCADGSIGNNTCGNPLIINGPVFAKNIELHRTYGANGSRSWNGPFAAGSNYLNSGAATPAEIFNLRSDVYQWIYQQISTENKTANVRYMRELSPRY